MEKELFKFFKKIKKFSKKMKKIFKKNIQKIKNFFKKILKYISSITIEQWNLVYRFTNLNTIKIYRFNKYLKIWGHFLKNIFLFNNIDFINVKMMYRKNNM